MLILIYVFLTAVAVAPFIAAIVDYRIGGDILDAIGSFLITIVVIFVVCVFFGSLGAIALSAWEYF